MKLNFKIILLISIIGFFQYSYSQNEKIGKVIVVKYRDSDDKFIQSTTDSEIDLLNKRKHNVLISNKSDSLLIKTDSLSYFQIPENYFDYCSITVNKNYRELREEFLFLDGLGIKDTIKLKVFDYHISNKIDSTKTPEFYTKFNTTKAEQDFFNGNKRYLLGEGIEYSTEFLKQLKSKSKEFGFKIEYPNKMSGILAEHRILYRYNNRMRELLGLKNWW